MTAATYSFRVPRTRLHVLCFLDVLSTVCSMLNAEQRTFILNEAHATLLQQLPDAVNVLRSEFGVDVSGTHASIRGRMEDYQRMVEVLQAERIRPCLEHLPPLDPTIKRRGPTDHSNWVIPGHVLCGGYPGGVTCTETESILSALISSGVTTFVCLQEADELELMPTNYCSVLQSMALHRHEPLRADVVRFPITDNATVDDRAVVRLVGDLLQRLSNRETLYIHCAGGHGRTGTVVACLLGAVYNLTAEESLWCVQYFHQQRVQTFGMTSPATPPQYDQVRRILAVPPVPLR